MSQTAPPLTQETSSQVEPSSESSRVPYSGAIVWMACILLALLCNAGSLGGQEWIWTDDALIPRNPLIGALSGLQMVWTGTASPDRYLLPQFSPLSQTFFYFERMFFGDSPAGYRFVSVVLHGSCAAVLFLLLRGLRVRGALVVALLFVAHPTLVDSVSFLSERRNPLGGLLGLSALYLFFRAVGAIAAPTGKLQLLPDDKVRLYAMGAVLFVLGLFAQPAIAPLALVALIALWAMRRRVPPAFAAIAVTLAVLGAALIAVSSRIELTHSGYTQQQWERAPTPAGEMAVRLQTAGRAVLFYAQRTFLPFPLAADYGRLLTPNDLAEFRELAPDTSVERFATRKSDVGADRPLAWIAPLVVVGVLFAFYALSGRLGRTPFALATSFILLLLPFLGFIDFAWMQYTFVSHRSLYLAIIPGLLALVMLLTPWLGQRNQRASMIATVAVVLLLMTSLSLTLAFRYQYNVKFWRESDFAANTTRQPVLNVLTRTPWYSRLQAANSLLELHTDDLIRTGKVPFDPDIDPRQPGTFTRYMDRHFAFAAPLYQDESEKARAAYRDVLERMRPGNQEALVSFGRAHAAFRQDQEAMNVYAFAMTTRERYSPAFRAAGDLVRRQADLAPTNPALRMTTLGYYEQAVNANPRDAEAHLLVAETAWEIAKRLPDADREGIVKRMEQAALALDAADEIRPYDVAQLVRSAKTLIEMRALPAAASRLQTARTIEPENIPVLMTLADAFLAGEQPTGAESAYRQVIGLDADYVGAYVNLSGLLASQNRLEEAEQVIRDGLERSPEHPRLLDAEAKLADLQTRAATQPAR